MKCNAVSRHRKVRPKPSIRSGSGEGIRSNFLNTNQRPPNINRNGIKYFPPPNPHPSKVIQPSVRPLRIGETITRNVSKPVRLKMMPVISSLRSRDIPVRAFWGVDLAGVDLFVFRVPDDCLGDGADFVGARFLDELPVVLAGVFFVEILVLTLVFEVFFAINSPFV